MIPKCECKIKIFTLKFLLGFPLAEFLMPSWT
jgi:hypothetical protein